MTLRTDLLPPASMHTTTPANATPPARRKRSPALIAMLAMGVIGFGVLGYAVKGTGVVSYVLVKLHLRQPHVRPPLIQPPKIEDTEMAKLDCWTGVDPTKPIIIPVTLPNGPLDAKTITDDAISLFRVDTRQRVPAQVTFNGREIRVTPTAPLEANKNYRAHILPGIKDVKGIPFRQRSFAFTTSTPLPTGVAFERVTLPEAQGYGGYSPGKGDPAGFDAESREANKKDHDDEPPVTTFSEGFTGVEFGPDGKLYACTDHGKIVRFTVEADGQLSHRETFTTLPDHEGGERLVTGFCFDPKSTPQDMTIYITSSEFGFGFPQPVSDFSGRIARLSGPDFSKYECLVTNLPRSGKDHATNQPHFGPDGALYIPQPSNTATGGPDATWFFREEHLLNATILRLDLNKLKPGQTLDAMTKDVDTFKDVDGDGKQGPNETERYKGSYDPYAKDAPLTIYATGMRMPYDLLWHSNGHLYSAVNGASAGGATPASPDGRVPRVGKVTIVEHDWLFRVDRPGQYFGHPNPSQGTYVLNGGNPTAAPDFNEVSDYPVGVQPESNLTHPIYDFGGHVSANGTIEYKSNAFNGALKGKVIICRYSYYQDLIVLGFDDKGDVNYAVTGIPGTTKLDQPLDLAEDPRNGNLYVCEYGVLGGAPPRITLLRPLAAK